MATAARGGAAGLHPPLGRLIARHVCHCPARPCVFAAVLASGGTGNAVRTFYNPPLPEDQEVVPDSYCPGHGISVRFKARDISSSLGETEGAVRPRFQCSSGTIDCRVVCGCAHADPHDWMFDAFCVKYNWFVKNVVLCV